MDPFSRKTIKINMQNNIDSPLTNSSQISKNFPTRYDPLSSSPRSRLENGFFESKIKIFAKNRYDFHRNIQNQLSEMQQEGIFNKPKKDVAQKVYAILYTPSSQQQVSDDPMVLRKVFFDEEKKIKQQFESIKVIKESSSPLLPVIQSRNQILIQELIQKQYLKNKSPSKNPKLQESTFQPKKCMNITTSEMNSNSSLDTSSTFLMNIKKSQQPKENSLPRDAQYESNISMSVPEQQLECNLPKKRASLNNQTIQIKQYYFNTSQYLNNKQRENDKTQKNEYLQTSEGVGGGNDTTFPKQKSPIVREPSKTFFYSAKEKTPSIRLIAQKGDDNQNEEQEQFSKSKRQSFHSNEKKLLVQSNHPSKVQNNVLSINDDELFNSIFGPRKSSKININTDFQNYQTTASSFLQKLPTETLPEQRSIFNMKSSKEQKKERKLSPPINKLQRNVDTNFYEEMQFKSKRKLKIIPQKTKKTALISQQQMNLYFNSPEKTVEHSMEDSQDKCNINSGNSYFFCESTKIRQADASGQKNTDINQNNLFPKHHKFQHLSMHTSNQNQQSDDSLPVIYKNASTSTRFQNNDSYEGDFKIFKKVQTLPSEIKNFDFSKLDPWEIESMHDHDFLLYPRAAVYNGKIIEIKEEDDDEYESSFFHNDNKVR